MVNQANGDVAIIGMGFRMPGADSKEKFWDILKNGVECINEFPKSRRSGIEEYLSKKLNKSIDNIEYENGGYLDNIDMFACEKFKISQKEARLIDPCQRLFLEVAYETMEDAGYVGERLADKNIGVYIGYNSKHSKDYLSLVKEYEKESMSVAYTGNLASIIPSRISYYLDLKGPSMLIDTACSSSIVALHTAMLGLRNGDCTSAIVGGISITLFPLKKGENEKIGVDSEDGRARTFDIKSSGTGWGEGVASIMIKPLKNALEDGDNIYVVIKGSAINQDGYSMGITIPCMESQTAAIQRAIEKANVNPEEIAYIEAHGTGTLIGDPVEIEAIKNAYSKYTDKKQFCGIGSVKTNIGHLQAAAGMASVIKMLLSLKHSQIPPTLNFVQPNYAINFEESPVYIVNKLQEYPNNEKKYCAISAFGFSGTNSHVILQGFQQEKEEEKERETKRVVTISAESQALLLDMLNKYYHYVEQEDSALLSNIAYTSNVAREHQDCRVAFIISDKKELMNKIEMFFLKPQDELESNGIFHGFNVVTKKGKTIEEGTAISKKEKKELMKQAAEVMEEFSENENKIYELCKLYAQGADISWKGIYENQEIRSVPIPVSSLKKVNCWVHDKENKEQLNLQYNPYWRI